MFFDNKVFKALGLQISVEKLEKFKSLLYEENQRLNLTRVPVKDFYTRHALDSLLLFPFLKFLSAKLNAKTVLDFGTGGGFPGVPLALALPDICFHLYDKSPKKRKYLHSLVEALQVKNIAVIASPDLYPIIVSRAVAPLGELLRLTAPHLDSNGIGLAIKGNKIFEEVSQLTDVSYVQVFDHTFNDLPLNSKIVAYSFAFNLTKFSWSVAGFNLIKLPSLLSTQTEEN